MSFLTDSGKSYIIFRHIRSDGDAIACSYGLAIYLQSIGNKVLVLGHDPVPQQFIYQLEGYADDFDEDAIPDGTIRICVDTSTPDRIGKYSEQKIDICIDHHIGNSFTAPIKIVDEEAGACAEIIFDLLKDHIKDNPMRKKICDLLFLGIITDSNCFRNESTRPETFRVAYELAAMGADYCKIAQKHALIKSPEYMEFEKRLVKTYRIIEEYGIVSAYLTQRDAKDIGMDINTYEVLSSLPLEMEGTRVSLVARELPDGTSRIAIRTRGDIDADVIARQYEGGGHKNASGTTLRMGPEQIIDLFIKTTIEYLSESKF